MSSSKSRIEPLTGHRLKAHIHNQIRLSNTHHNQWLDKKRRTVWDDYYGRPYGNEIQGRSQIVTSESSDYMETIMADLTEVFLEQPGPWSFRPTRLMSKEACEQATELTNYTIYDLNDGWTLIHDTLKASVFFDASYIKCTWYEGEENKRRIIKGQPGIEVVKIMRDPTRRIVDIVHSMGPLEGKPVDVQDFTLQGIYDVEIEWDVPAYPKLWGCPYEEVIHTPNVSTLDSDDLPFIAHKYISTRSEMVQEGYDEDLVYSLPTYTEYELSRDRQARFKPETYRHRTESFDPSVERVMRYECYLLGDFNGDGIASYGRVDTSGSGEATFVLPNPETGEEVTPVYHHPFVTVSYIRLPYKHPGRGMGEQLQQAQQEKTVQRRMINDQIYFSVNGRHVINERVDQPSYMSNIPGVPIMVNDDQPVQGAIENVGTEVLNPMVLQYLEYLDRETENRVGVKLNGELLDPSMLNSTFGGINLLMGASKKRELYAARIMAEGLKNLPKKILDLYIHNQDEPLMIPIGDQWRQIDARSWDVNARVVVNFGFATGSQMQRVAMYERILAKQEQEIQMQGGFEGPLVNVDDYARMLHEWAKSLGLIATDMAFNKGDEVLIQYRQQMLQKQQADQQAQAQNPQAIMAQLESMKIQTQGEAKMAQIQMDERLKRYEMDLADQREREKIGLKHRSDVLNIQLDHEADIYETNLENSREDAKSVADYRRTISNDLLNAATKGPVQ